MKIVNKSERPISITDIMLVPLEPKDVPDELLEHPRIKELFEHKELELVENDNG